MREQSPQIAGDISRNPAPVPVTWLPRPHPLAPEGVAGWGIAAARLAARLLDRDDAALAGISGVASGDLLVLLAPTDDLPWSDGVRYLGRDPEAPSLLLPTSLAPSAPIALFERAILSRAGKASSPIAVLPDRGAIVSLADARPVSRGTLLNWLERYGKNHPPHHPGSLRQEES